MSKIYGNVIGASPGLLEQHFGWAKGTNQFKFQQVKAGADKAMIQLGQVISKDLLPVLVKLIPLLTGAVSAFGKLPGPVKKGIVLFAALVVILGPFLLILGGVITVVGKLITGIGFLINVVAAVHRSRAAGRRG
jgi:phage-related minor tail protein